MLQSTLEVHKNGAYILLVDNKSFKNVFPANNGISDVVLFINTLISEKVKSNELKPQLNDFIYISKIAFSKLIREVKNRYSKGFSKEYREMTEENLQTEAVKYMKQFDMIRESKETEEYIIMPICFKIIGKYPKDFENKD